MCGISGFFSDKHEIELKKYYDAHTLLKHRGPDDEGFSLLVNQKIEKAKGDNTIDHFCELPDVRSFNGSRLIIGHHRLSIIDLSWRGHQPMCDEDEHIWLAYNGEIYNYIELRKELEDLGHCFKSDSDSEVFLKAFKEWNVDCFNKFNGMWAAAIYNTVEDKLILTRDRFGIKPLFYYIYKNSLYFSSEVKFLLKFIDQPAINNEIAAEYLLFSLLDHVPETMFKDIYQLEPGHYGEFKNGLLEITNYWKYNPTVNKKLTYSKALNKLDQLFCNSVDLRMRSDVPVGSLLSGGIDSTAIVCDLFRRDKIKDSQFSTFSADFEEDEFSEKKYIEKTVDKINCNSHYIYPDPLNLETEIKNLLYYQEFPIRSLSIYSQWCIYQYINQNTSVVVLLNGQGSDEIFGGYTAHYNSLIREYLRKFQFFSASREAKIFSKIRNQKHKNLFFLFCFDNRLTQFILSKNLKFFEKFKLHRNKNLKFLKDEMRLNKCEKYSSNIFVQHLYSNLKYSALREYLRYDDRTSMAFSLETRLPYMDVNLIEFAYMLPNEYKIKNGVNKKILRDFARPFTTIEVVERKDKMGFVSPQEIWQKTILKSYLDKIITKKNIEDNFSFIEAENVVQYYYEYQHNSNDDWPFFWRICCLYEWKKLWIDQ